MTARPIAAQSLWSDSAATAATEKLKAVSAGSTENLNHRADVDPPFPENGWNPWVAVELDDLVLSAHHYLRLCAAVHSFWLSQCVIVVTDRIVTHTFHDNDSNA